jgi:hypothetical protein
MFIFSSVTILLAESDRAKVANISLRRRLMFPVIHFALVDATSIINTPKFARRNSPTQCGRDDYSMKIRIPNMTVGKRM